ncbi:baseplate J/gp47 family protein [Pseudoalteromonas sp. MMG022]|uniref:baseplate assembly protein n=1 Tax=Pseudoalteromonas sp. MMG022 TaxID=2909978 RepID=UPI001F2006FE|nr:baseplate J/gp47 family protein [Pseudoalteromonas sp. MMG022]MCF6435235.1 baseplate J/gp47 family protein [Pseudoalteromonas sp. MMG022]
MRVFNLLDMSKVPLPDTITELDFEQTLSQLKERLLSHYPQYAEALSFESEPMQVMLEMLAYQQLLFDGKLNDAIKGNMLASATGNDLDAIAARYNLARQDSETDERFKRRIQMVFEGLNTAGSKQAYQFHALSADARVKDVYVLSPEPCDIHLTILSHEQNGEPSDELLNTLRNHFGLDADGSISKHASKVRPLGDRLTITGPTVKPFSLDVAIEIAPGPAASVVEQTVKAALSQYLAQQSLLGRDISQMGLFAALNQPGVESGRIINPNTDIHIAANEVAVCTGITVSSTVIEGE